MEIINPRIEKYALGVIRENASNRPFNDVLSSMEEYAAETDFPIIGPQIGLLLRQLAYISGAKRIIEMGSGFGYSAFWFASGMRHGGKIICTDNSEEHKKKALDYFRQTDYFDLIDYRVGDALEILKGFDEPFDIILNDIDKERYPKALEESIKRLRTGGILITDNIFWHGRVIDDDPEPSTKGILEFNRKSFESDKIISSMIPIRDGLGIAVKL